MEEELNICVDMDTCTNVYAKRFAGKVGKWMLDVQDETVRKLVGRIDAHTVLDLGGVHCQLVDVLCAHNLQVTIYGSSQLCPPRVSDCAKECDVTYAHGSLLKLPYEDKTFDIATCFRLISHVHNWQQLISELCRVTKKSVIIEYPDLCSFNITKPFLFPLKKKIEKSTREFFVYSKKQIVECFNHHGFIVHQVEKEYFFPLALYRVCKSEYLAQLLEACAGITGLRRLFGSPVVVRFDRVPS